MKKKQALETYFQKHHIEVNFEKIDEKVNKNTKVYHLEDFIALLEKTKETSIFIVFYNLINDIVQAVVYEHKSSREYPYKLQFKNVLPYQFLGETNDLEGLIELLEDFISRNVTKEPEFKSDYDGFIGVSFD